MLNTNAQVLTPSFVRQGQIKGKLQGGTNKVWIAKDISFDKQKEGEERPRTQLQAEDQNPGKTTKNNSINYVGINHESNLHSNANGNNSIAGEPLLQENEHIRDKVDRNKDSNNKSKQQVGNASNQQPAEKVTYANANQFPRVSNNFAKKVPYHQRNKPDVRQPSMYKEQPSQNPQHNSKNENTPEPAPYTVVQTLTARLRQNQSKYDTPLDITATAFTTKQGLPAVIFEIDDFLVKLAERWKYTLVGKFSNTMPKVELIRKNFILQTQLSGGVKIAHFNSRHVYIT
ncbi:hypothetical protein KY289_001132 [Solanum tuberosum]|nr:hypothetical protein KY289_001132 [Solanum tuberosum]